MHWNSINLDSEIYTYEYFIEKDVCRLCWNKDPNMLPLDENIEFESENSLKELIKNYLEIDLSEINPSKICGNCNEELKRMFSYKKFCQESNEKLRSIMEKGPNALINIDFELSAIKEEITEDNFDNLDPFVDNSELKKPVTNKLFINHSMFRKKYAKKKSDIYCNICCINFNNKEEMSSHNNECHGIEDDGKTKTFRCFGCGKHFKTKNRRLGHEVNFCKDLKDGYKCNLCDRYLPKRSIYEYHMRDHRHDTLTELPEHIFECRKCDKKFKSNEVLRNHIKNEHDNRNFICDTCGRVFSRQDYLYKHKFIHTGVRRHHCPHCDFKAIQRSSLTVHLRKHTGERPFSCDMCPQRCVSSSNLRAHRRRHLGVKKYECNVCNKKFGYKISLEEHITATHVRSETFSCEHCGATYARIRGLKRHLAAKHAKQTGKTVVESNLQLNNVDGAKVQILKDVEYELKDGSDVVLLKNQVSDVYME